MDVKRRHIIWPRKQNMGPIDGDLGATSYAPFMVRKQNASRQFVPVTHGLSQFECSYGDPGYLKQVMEIAKDWKETHRVLSGQYTNTVIFGYLEWKSRRVGSLLTPLINETVQLVYPQPKEVLSKAEILRQEFQVERDRLIKENFMLQEEIRSWKCKAEKDKAAIQKMANRRNATIDDLHTKNERLRDELKYRPRFTKKKATMSVES